MTPLAIRIDGIYQRWSS